MSNNTAFVLASFGDILRESRPKATQALKKVLGQRLIFHAEEEGRERYFRLEGTLGFGKVLDLVARSTRVRTPQRSVSLLTLGDVRFDLRIA